MAIKYGKLQHLRHYYPKLFDFLVIRKGLGAAMVDLRLGKLKGVRSRIHDLVLNRTVKARKAFEEILKRRPCFFDKL